MRNPRSCVDFARTWLRPYVRRRQREGGSGTRRRCWLPAGNLLAWLYYQATLRLVASRPAQGGIVCSGEESMQGERKLGYSANSARGCHPSSTTLLDRTEIKTVCVMAGACVFIAMGIFMSIVVDYKRKSLLRMNAVQGNARCRRSCPAPLPS